MIFNMVVVLAALIMVALFAVMNASAVSVSLIFWHIKEISLAVVILSSVGIGILLAGAVALYQKMNDRMKIRSLESKMKELERQMNQRNLPLQ